MPIPHVAQTSLWILQCRQIERTHPLSMAAHYAENLRAELEAYLGVLNAIESGEAAPLDEAAEDRS